jgi:salicyloyl-CoA 5-hydroxylase
VVTATAKFIWFGTTYPFDGLTFVHEEGGSGTKMAMEDAIALAAALEGIQGDRTDPDTADTALAVYENERSGRVARIQDAARPSLSWWEHFGRSYRHLPRRHRPARSADLSLLGVRCGRRRGGLPRRGRQPGWPAAPG